MQQEQEQYQDPQQEITDEYVNEQVEQLERILKLRRLQRELSDHNSQMALNSVRELQAHITLEQMMNPQNDDKNPAEEQENGATTS